MIERVPPVDRTRRTPNSDADSHEVSQLLRAVREERGLSLSQLSRMCGLTRSFLSQVENNQASPSVASLQKIVSALDMTLGDLFHPSSEPNPVVRREERRRIHYPSLDLDDELLVPSMRGKLQVMYSRIEPHGGSGDEPYVHDADEECVIILKGALEMNVDGIEYYLREGDTVTFSSRLAHSWRNPLDETTECIWIITPPGF